MVPATTAGVLFTANPITGASDEVVIEAAWGLGEALVGGQVTPDTIIVEKATGRVKQYIVGDKVVMTVLTEDGTTEQVEWAIADQHIFVLQSRPITPRLVAGAVIRRQEDYNVPGDDSWDRPEAPAPQPFDMWTRTNAGENFPFPISPLSSTAWPALFIQGELPKQGPDSVHAPPAPGVGRRFYGRLYINEGSLVHSFTELGLPTSFLDTVWGSGGRGLRPSDDTFHPLRLLRRLPSFIGQDVKAARQQPKKQRAPKLTTEQLFAVSKWTGSKDAAAKLVMALSGIYTAEIGPNLWRMAQTLRAAGLDALVHERTSQEALAQLQHMPEAEPFLEQFQAFLRQYGYRCPNDAELLNPRWIDAPEQVITFAPHHLPQVTQNHPARGACQGQLPLLCHQISLPHAQALCRVGATLDGERMVGQAGRYLFLDGLRHR